MGRVVVFDSGFGSLSIIKAIQKQTKADIIYFADQKNFPYGKKSKKELENIIKNNIVSVKEKFNPDLIVVGSNTPSLLLYKIFLDDPTVIGVLPPLLEAQQLTKTNSIALLVTHSVAKSIELDSFINKNRNDKTQIIKIDSSELVSLVESGKFIFKKKLCMERISSILKEKFIMHNVDVATLSSTHLPFLIPFLTKIFPHVVFLDPAAKVANQIINNKLFIPSKKNTLKIFSSGDIGIFQKNLRKIGIKNTIEQINF